MSVSVRDLLEAGAHFGHQTHRWNPKMKPFIYGARNGIYIIDLEKTKKQWSGARKAILDASSKGKKILFVGTKPQAQDIIREEASRAGQFYVNKRWLGGMLTNFETIKSRIKRMDEIQKVKEDQTKKVSKKDLIGFDKEYQKLEKSLSGIREMGHLPGLLIVIDPKKEHIAIKEANKLHIPVVAVTDTNCDPDGIDYVIPSNDDALKAIRIFVKDAANACLEGKQAFEEKIQQQTRDRLKAEAEAKKQTEEVKKVEVAPSKETTPEVVAVETEAKTSISAKVAAQGE